MLVLSLVCAATRLSAQSYLGTWAENQRAVQGAGSHFGRYSVDDRDHTITFHIDHSGGTGVITWRRVVPPSLAGTWTLTAADEIRPDGKRVHAYGDHPEGQLIFDEAGNYSVWVTRAMRTKFKSGEKSRGTADEYKAASLDISSHYGRYAVDTVSHTITFDIVHASFPNLDGVEQKRPYELKGDELTYRLPPRADGTISISAWRRAR
jgi:Lipocalin-like domain